MKSIHEDFLSKEEEMETKHKPLNDFSGGIDLDEFREMVAVNAYYRAEKRGFESPVMQEMTGSKPSRKLAGYDVIGYDKLLDVLNDIPMNLPQVIKINF
jgi:hypothetical protein